MSLRGVCVAAGLILHTSFCSIGRTQSPQTKPANPAISREALVGTWHAEVTVSSAKFKALLHATATQPADAAVPDLPPYWPAAISITLAADGTACAGTPSLRPPSGKWEFKKKDGDAGHLTVREKDRALVDGEIHLEDHDTLVFAPDEPDKLAVDGPVTFHRVTATPLPTTRPANGK